MEYRIDCAAKTAVECDLETITPDALAQARQASENDRAGWREREDAVLRLQDAAERGSGLAADVLTVLGVSTRARG